MSLDDLTRLALFERWGETCVWCGRPLIFADMEVEHLLPKSLTGDELAAALRLHGRPQDLDLDSLENLAPSCGPCNRTKGNRPPPDTPRISTLLRDAHDRAPRIRANAERLAKSRSVQRALTIVLTAVGTGDEPTIRKLREAVDELRVGFAEATGRPLGAIHPALQQLVDVGEVLSRADPEFSYAVAVHETGAPAPSPSPETVMSLAQIDETTTQRIDLAPRGPEAMQRHGPQFTLRPTNDEDGRRAAAELAEALRTGIDATITGGLDLVFDRLPPGLSDLVGRPLIAGTLEIRAGRPPRPPDWHAAIRASTQPRSASIRVLLRPLDQAEDGWDHELAGSFGGLTVRLLVRRTRMGGQMRWTLVHRRDNSRVRDQLAALELLEALGRGGALIVEDRGPRKRPTINQPAESFSFDPRSAALLAFLRDVRSIEEWTRQELSLPDQVSPEEAQHVAIAANVIRLRGREMTWRDIRMRVAESGMPALQAGRTVTIRHKVSVRILGTDLSLGDTVLSLNDYRIERAVPAADAPGQLDVELAPATEDASDVFERLVRISKPPPPPPRARSGRSGKRKKKKRKR